MKLKNMRKSNFKFNATSKNILHNTLSVDNKALFIPNKKILNTKNIRKKFLSKNSQIDDLTLPSSYNNINIKKINLSDNSYLANNRSLSERNSKSIISFSEIINKSRKFFNNEKFNNTLLKVKCFNSQENLMHKTLNNKNNYWEKKRSQKDIYDKIFPKLSRNRRSKKEIINNMFNFYFSRNEREFNLQINKENQKRLKKNKLLINLSSNNIVSRNKIEAIRQKEKFLLNVFNYCYPNFIKYKIFREKKALNDYKFKQKKFLLPTEEIDILYKKKLDEISKGFINNSFYILNKNKQRVISDSTIK